MSCARCKVQDNQCRVSLTPNVHEGLCIDCCDAWIGHANATLVNRNNGAAVLGAFRRWCEAGKEKAA